MEEAVLSDTDQHHMVSSFLEIAVGQTADTARQFLQVLFELHRPLIVCLFASILYDISTIWLSCPVLTDWKFGGFVIWVSWCVVCNCVFAELVP